MTQQYITLPSNTPDFSTNRTNSFRVKLPYAFSFEGNWELALSEVQYPVSWNTVKVTDGNIWIVYNHNGIRVLLKFQVKNGFYNDINELVYAVNYALSQEGQNLPNKLYLADLTIFKIAKLKKMDYDAFLRWQKHGYTYHDLFMDPDLVPNVSATPEGELLLRLHQNMLQSSLNRYKTETPHLLGEEVKVSYNPGNKRVELQLDTKAINRIYFDPALTFMLGFNKDRVQSDEKITADYNSDVSGGLNSFYIYCNIVESQCVGNSLEHLLRTVPLTEANKLGNIVHKEFWVPHYVGLLNKNFDTIEIEIRDNNGKLIDFQFGEVILKLHFRKKTLLNF